MAIEDCVRYIMHTTGLIAMSVVPLPVTILPPRDRQDVRLRLVT
jgi:hypothetical protein